MQKTFTLRFLPQEAANEIIVKSYIAQSEGISQTDVTGFHILKHSIDARGRQPYINLAVKAFIGEPFQLREKYIIDFKNVATSNETVAIIGAGPAGLFAALQLLELGIKPIIVERGKDVRARRRDLAILNKEGIVNPESNYCFGEGGAGTYSDGKLYTRSSKRGDINRILHLFVHFGADEKILYESHPHIGTNKLPQIITSMREHIINCGGEIHFEKKCIDFEIDEDKIIAIRTKDGDKIKADAFILATGHSARDIYQLLHAKKILIEAKPFALGVRVEHPQVIIDAAQYHLNSTNNQVCLRPAVLPPAAYSWVQQVNDKGVFSFCMCPGGIIAPAATAPGELVVNGWSPSKRNNPFANSGIVVSVEEKDIITLMKENKVAIKDNPLLMMEFQKMVEQKAYQAGGGKLVAPAQRLIDFCDSKLSGSIPINSYLPGLVSADLRNVLPSFILKRLQQAFKEHGKKMKEYYTNEAVVVATESRTSSPVRIPRNADTLQHPQVKNLYPCGEGAGYAGGIVSAAMDGEKCARMIAAIILST